MGGRILAAHIKGCPDRLPERHPACRRRETQLGFRMERENLAGDGKGKGTSSDNREAESTQIRAGRHVATLESGKWVGGVPVPFGALVVERNEAVLADPHLVNVDPYGKGWIARLHPDEFQHRVGRPCHRRAGNLRAARMD